MNRQDVIFLADWLFNQRQAVKAYADNPELMMNLLSGSLAHNLRNKLHAETRIESRGRIEDRWVEEFWDHVEYGPFDDR